MKIQKSYIDNIPTLYIIPTPIGNLDDMTFRSVKILNELDYLFCEDTRVTQKLLNHFQISIKTQAYHEHNQEVAGNKIISLLKSGNDVGLVSDAGMPGISDPGYDIIAQVRALNYNVVVLPGASAFIVATVASNFASKQFTYHGFLNKQTTKRQAELTELLSLTHPSAIYETPHKLVKTLNQIYELNADTQVCVGREISKKFEEYVSGSAQEVFEYYKENGVKGECVIIINPKHKKDVILDPVTEYLRLINDEGLSKKDSIKKVAKSMGVNKNEIYQLVLESEKHE